ncbi:hypothetical protein Q4511_15715 [Paracoccus sp. 1_MG-2023]|uniref:hypothetical protein n=1 Tax=unclassified Paracoccus (in: a-proteobacteria) TaxID=2688777 RepID=UPI001C0A0D9C|nr:MULTISPECIES: hypothetical protein [unclassified Paracoccus (in: a-proteobacteria)]MBU2958964.1 hypothetical protein [Paracoccus sp. C2R09]MDO6670365.1 hypothetical protein [Paracoccus sp. 1_MG-2023]
MWVQAQSRLTVPLSRASRELGRLEATLKSFEPEEAEGLCKRFALLETEAMLWGQGLILSRDEIGREILEARSSSDPEALRLARWSMRRLAGQGAQSELRSFLGFHAMSGNEANPFIPDLPYRGREFEEAEAEFFAAIDDLGALDPLARGPAVLQLWRQSGLLRPGQVVEPAVWSARHMASGAEGVSFVPMGIHGRRVWSGSGPADLRLGAHLNAVEAGCREARLLADGLRDWSRRARHVLKGTSGDTADRLVRALVARPMLFAADAELMAGISRTTAVRLLTRLQSRGLLREITGTRRFRLWSAVT